MVERRDNPVVSTVGTFAPEFAVQVLRALAEADWKRLAASGLVVGITENGLGRLALPLPSNPRSAEFRAAKAYLDEILAQIENLGGKSNKAAAYGAHKRSLEYYHAPVPAAILMVVKALERADPESGARDTDAQRVLALVMGPDGKKISRQVADILRHARDPVPMRVLDAQDREIGTAVVAGDSAEEFGTLSARLSRADQLAEVVPLREWSLGLRSLWAGVAEGQVINAAALRDLGRLLEAADAGARPDGADYSPLFHSLAVDKPIIGWVAPVDEAAPAFAKSFDVPPVQGLDVTGIVVKGGAEVTDTLMTKVAELNPKIGYEVSLRPVRRRLSKGVDVEELRKQIEELQSYIDEAQLFSAPNLRLLRFSDAQLPAMIDMLRDIPPAALKNDEDTSKVVRYAAGHSSGRAGPVHYLLYDPGDYSMHLAEMYWRRTTGDARPMGYWLEPHVAMASPNRTAGVAVFVPDQMLLVPSLVHFGGDILETLRLILGDLFANIEDLIKTEGSIPAFIFTQVDGSDMPIELEAIDMRHFAPLQRQLPWINDYLQVRDPAPLDRGNLESFAENLYDVSALADDMAEIETVRAAMTKEWNSALAGLRGEAFGLVEAVGTEMGATVERMSMAHRFLAAARKEMKALESLLGTAEKALAGHSAITGVLEEKDLAMRAAREQFTKRVTNEVTRGEAELDRLDKTIKDLKALLDSYRRSGSW